MISDKFKKRFMKLQKENLNDDFKITKRYIDATDTVFAIASYIGKYADDDAGVDAENVNVNDNVNNYKSIVIEFEVTKNNNYPYKLAFIMMYDPHNNIITEFKENQALKRFKENDDILNSIGYFNEIKFNTVVTSVFVYKTKWHKIMGWEQD